MVERADNFENDYMGCMHSDWTPEPVVKALATGLKPSRLT